MTKNISRGVYFLANDWFIDLVIAFLNSFRKYNLDIELCLIPFNNDVSRIIKLKEHYNFSILDNNNLFEFCDELSLNFHDKTVGHYRKLSLWDGIYDEFIYIDIDTIILSKIDFAFTLFENYDIITSKSDVKIDKQWVWKESVYETGLLNPKQIAYAANTGFIISKKGVIQINEIKNKIHIAKELKPHMVLFCQEQPFLNYLIVSSNRKYSSLYNLLDTEAYPENMVECWVGHKNFKKNGEYFMLAKNKVRKIFLIHWAGEWQLRKFDHQLYSILKKIGYNRKKWITRKFMPRKKLWKYFRNLNYLIK